MTSRELRAGAGWCGLGPEISIKKILREDEHSENICSLEWFCEEIIERPQTPGHPAGLLRPTPGAALLHLPDAAFGVRLQVWHQEGAGAAASGRHAGAHLGWRLGTGRTIL